MSDSNSPSDNLNNFVAGLALLSAFLSAILYYRAYLPSVKFKELDELLNETKSIYSQAEAEGLLPTNPQHLTRLKAWLKELEESRAELREETYKKTTPLSECMAVLRGLSKTIVKMTDDTKKLRASIVTTSEEQRRRRRGDYQPHSMALSGENLEAPATESYDKEDSNTRTLGHTITLLTIAAADETEQESSDITDQANDNAVVLMPYMLQRTDTSLSTSLTLFDKEQQTTKSYPRLSTLLWRVLIQMRIASPERLAESGFPPTASDLSV